MARYRKRPVVIEAFCWTGGPDQAEDPVWAVEAIQKCELRFYGAGGTTPPFAIIHTLEGDMKVSAGDYIIKGVKGELYPCKPEIFEATYEKVED